MGQGVIRVFLSLDSRGGALEILIRWVPGLECEAIYGTCVRMRDWLTGGGASGPSSPRAQASMPAHLAHKAKG